MWMGGSLRHTSGKERLNIEDWRKEKRETRLATEFRL